MHMILFRISLRKLIYMHIGRTVICEDCVYEWVVTLALDLVTRFDSKLVCPWCFLPHWIRIMRLNRGGPPIEYQLYGANHEPSWNQLSHWLSETNYVKLDDHMLSYLVYFPAIHYLTSFQLWYFHSVIFALFYFVIPWQICPSSLANIPLSQRISPWVSVYPPEPAYIPQGQRNPSGSTYIPLGQRISPGVSVYPPGSAYIPLSQRISPWVSVYPPGSAYIPLNQRISPGSALSPWISVYPPEAEEWGRMAKN